MPQLHRRAPWVVIATTAAFTSTVPAAVASPSCPPLWQRGVLGLDWQPGFLHVDEYDDGTGLTISSFFNVRRNPPGGPPLSILARDRVARIRDLDTLDFDQFDPATDVDDLTDVGLPPSVPFGRTVWPNDAARVPDGVLPFEGVVVPQGFHPAPFPGRLTIVDVATHQEYVVHQSTQGSGGPTFPLDPANSPRFYHRVLFHDMNGDGLDDLVTARSGFRVGPFVYPPFSELVYFVNPGAAIDPARPWREVVLWGGPAAGFLGPDIHLAMHDFEDDGVPEIVATHFFTGAPAVPGGPPAPNGRIALYGAPAGGTWADVNALAFRLPRVATLSADQGYPFDVQIVDLDRDGRADILATNHQPDGCTPRTASAVAGRVYALEAPAGDPFTAPWTTHVLLDGIRPNPSLPGSSPPGRLAPGRAQAFAPVRILDGLVRPWIVVGGDEAGKVWLLAPANQRRDDWGYDAAVVFDIDATYGAGTTSTPTAETGRAIGTIGGIALRYDHPGPFGVAELWIPVFEARDIHVMSFRPGWWWERASCPAAAPPTCPAP